MFQTCFHRIHAFLVVMRYRDWPAERHVGDGFRGLNTLWVRLTQLSREKKFATNCSHHELHTVKVLNLTTGTRNITLAIHGYIDIASEGALCGEKYEYFLKKRRCSIPFPCFHHLIPVHAKPIGGTVRMLQLLPEI